MWLTLLMRNWQLVVIGFLTFALLLTTSAWRSAEKNLIEEKVKVGVMTEQWAAQIQISETAKQTYATTVKVINDDHKKLLEQAKVAAVANFTRAVLRTPSRVPNVSSDSAATAANATYSPIGIDEFTSSLLADCSATVVQVEEWQRWAKMNNLPIEVIKE